MPKLKVLQNIYFIFKNWIKNIWYEMCNWNTFRYSSYIATFSKNINWIFLFINHVYNVSLMVFNIFIDVPNVKKYNFVIVLCIWLQCNFLSLFLCYFFQLKNSFMYTINYCFTTSDRKSIDWKFRKYMPGIVHKYYFFPFLNYTCDFSV